MMLRRLRGRYAGILTAALLTFVLEPVVATGDRTPWVLAVAIFLVILGSVRALWTSRSLLVATAVLGLAYLGGETFHRLTGTSTLLVATDLSGMAFFATVSIGILWDVFTRDEITLDTVFGASAVYLLIGLLFARVFLLVEILQPGSFAVSDPLLRELRDAGWRTSGIMQYFSLVTLTTVGYGDVSPVSPLARNLAVVEAFIAQLFIAAVIARLISLYTMQRPAGR